MHDTFRVRCRGIVIHDNKLLLVKHDNGNVFYSFPGGHLDYGEDPQACMARELEEELGVKADVGKLVAVFTFNDSKRNNEQVFEFFFLINNPEAFLFHEELEKTHDHEIGEVRWVSKGEELDVRTQEMFELWNDGSLGRNEVAFIS